ncbi:MAG: BspA family leucine-rich repeat surface protein [Cocleimonas sp.]
MQRKEYSIHVLLITALLSLTACGGNSENEAVNENNNHPEFSWAKVAVSNNFSPSGDISDTTPTFSWKAVTGATLYKFGHEDTETALRWRSYSVTPEQANCATTSICSYTPDDVTFAVGDSKAWWLRTYAPNTSTSNDWSAPYVFRIIGNNPPTTPSPSSEPISPKGLIPDSNPTFTWTPGNGATDYQFGFENQDGTDWKRYTVTADRVNCQSTQCSFQAVNVNVNEERFNFKKGDKKTWWVRSKINNIWSNWSNGSDFTIGVVSPPTDERPFILKIDTRIDGVKSFMIHKQDATGGFNYDFNYNVDCNSDGIFEATQQKDSYRCDYNSDGVYDISISGTYPHIGTAIHTQGRVLDENNPTRIVEIKQWGTQKWQSLDNAFYNATNMKITATDKPDLSQTTSMSGMFSKTDVFNAEISDWDVSNVTDFSNMFKDAKAFNQDISNWTIRPDAKLDGMFEGSAYTHPHPGTSLDTEAPTTPSNLRLEEITTTNPTNFFLKWDLSTDNVGVTHYEVYKDSIYLYKTNGVVQGALDKGNHTYEVVAFDAAGNESDWASIAVNIP